MPVFVHHTSHRNLRSIACLWAERGAWGLRRPERSVEAAEAAGRKPKASLFSRDPSSFRRVDRLKPARAGKRGSRA